TTHHVSPDRRTRVLELAEALFQSIHMQLDVGRYLGAPGRGTVLDTLDMPLNNRPWLADQFPALRKLPREEDRLREIEGIIYRTDPGPGGFYDDLGDPTRHPHLALGAGFAADPEFRRSALVGFEHRP